MVSGPPVESLSFDSDGGLVLRSEVALSSPPCVAGYAEQGRYFAE
jgi:hypothetical protein